MLVEGDAQARVCRQIAEEFAQKQQLHRKFRHASLIHQRFGKWMEYASLGDCVEQIFKRTILPMQGKDIMAVVSTF